MSIDNALWVRRISSLVGHGWFELRNSCLTRSLRIDDRSCCRDDGQVRLDCNRIRLKQRPRRRCDDRRTARRADLQRRDVFFAQCGFAGSVDAGLGIVARNQAGGVVTRFAGIAAQCSKSCTTLRLHISAVVPTRPNECPNFSDDMRSLSVCGPIPPPN
jgi:hypothetical protein